MRVIYWIRLPSVAFAYATLGAILATFVAWTFLDASFDDTLDVARSDIGLGQPLAPFSEFVHQWNHLGARILAFFALSILAALTLVVLAVRLSVGDTSGRSVRCWLLSVALLAAWLGFFSSFDRLTMAGVDFRVRRSLPRFQAAARPLLEHWPKEHGSLPEAGPYYAYADEHPDVLLLPDLDLFQVNESFGSKIERTKSGGLRFELSDAHDFRVEYHPAGSYPRSYTNWIESYYELIDTVPLNDSWYLARYKVSPQTTGR